MTTEFLTKNPNQIIELTGAQLYQEFRMQNPQVVSSQPSAPPMDILPSTTNAFLNSVNLQQPLDFQEKQSKGSLDIILVRHTFKMRQKIYS